MTRYIEEVETVIICSRMQSMLSKHFRAREFQTGKCNIVIVSNMLLRVLDTLRDKIGEPIYINSGYRTPEHNKAVGGSTLSYHMYGMAADIRADGHTPKQLYTILDDMLEGWGGLEEHETFLHVDVRAKEWRKPIALQGERESPKGG